MNIINSKSGILHENDDFSPKNPRKRGRGQNRGAPFLSINPPISKILDPPLPVMRHLRFLASPIWHAVCNKILSLIWSHPKAYDVTS